ncbi:hypothetical protein RRG08_000848 [Elysia crispata]|uniref:Uncharacterized protein n=1 Tax=Elysia crispata TaxID=231223 RepID=A0AAE1CYT1_9GAST|nr:hypothetical protein RRG08_000848 [Elysia crispata]
MMMLKIFVFGTLISSVYTVCSNTAISRCQNDFQQSVQGVRSEDTFCSKVRQYENCLHDRCEDSDAVKELKCEYKL